MKISRRDALRVMRFSKKIILVLLISVAVFTVACLVLFCIYGSVPDTLIMEFFGFFKLEGGALSLIKVAETVAEKIHKKNKLGGNESE